MKAYGVSKHSGKWCNVRACRSCGGKALRITSKGRNLARWCKKAARRASKSLAVAG